MIDVSLIFPCFCEAPHLARNIERVIALADKAGWTYEIILVEDHSPDDTRRVVAEVAAKHPQVVPIYHAHNRGRGAAVMTGAAAAKGAVLGFFDIDLEVAPEYMLPCVSEVRDGGNLVVGARHYAAAATPLRTILSRSYRGLAYAVLGIPTRVDSESGYKFFDRKSILELAPTFEHTGWFWDTEIVYRYLKAGYDVRAVPCEFVRDPTKRSTVRIVKDSVDYARALGAFARKHGRLKLSRRSAS